MSKKKKKFVADGVFYTEPNEVLMRELTEDGYSGVEVIVTGKLWAQRVKSMKFKDGYMISSGQPVNEYNDS